MTFNTSHSPEEEAFTPQQRSTRISVPVAQPRVTYILLVLLLLLFVADLVITEVTGRRWVFLLGAQWNEAVAAGWYWQLFTATFLHAGLTHLAFNCYALFILGRDIEGLYGPLWFTILYLLSGLAGSVAWYVLGSSDPSVGASGAIFGLFGAQAAFFLRNRQLFGALGRQRLTNVAVLLVINLVLGFTIPNINYIAHLGGLAAGFLLGLIFAPHYAVEWSYEGLGPVQRLVDSRANQQRWVALVATVIILLALVVVGNQRWAG